MLSHSSIYHLEELSRKAGKAILDIYKREDFGIEHKEDESPLTKADQASNRIICEGLRRLEESYPIISEENKSIPFEERKKYKYYWLVDPLDGTKEFIKKNGEFTTNIALIKNNVPIAGFIFIPVEDTYYYALKDQGAYKVDSTGSTSRLECKTFQKNEEGLIVVASRSHLNDETKDYINQLKNPEIINRGSSLKFLAIAEGKAHLYPRLGPTMEWDTAAAQAVLEGAGGKVLRYNDNQPLQYNKEDLLNPYFIAQGNMQ